MLDYKEQEGEEGPWQKSTSIAHHC